MQPPAIPAQGNRGGGLRGMDSLAGPPIEALKAAPVPTEASVTERGVEVRYTCNSLPWLEPGQGRDRVHALGHQNHRRLHQ